jgi:rhodanese-related sulfurtransferase
LASITTSVNDNVIPVNELKNFTNSFQAIDVRSATEFAAGHIPAAINIPMDEIESRLADIPPNPHVILVCQSGQRSAIVYDLIAARVPNLHQLAGGTDAWRAAGLPLVASTRTRWALERQVRLIAGLLVLTGFSLGSLVNPAWFWLSGFVGAGLVFAGTTNFCAMAHLLALLPWNRPGSSMKCST